MKISFKSITTCACFVAIALSSGCKFKNNAIPGADIPFAKADYTLGGKVSDEACGVYIFAIDWGRLFKRDTADRKAPASGFSIPFVGGETREVHRALYQSLEKMPDATHLTEIRTENSFKGFGSIGIPLFGKRCAKVTSQAVQMGTPLAGQVQ
ncbi:MAG: hypothetical protein ACPHRO_09575 [Nannocystaceae bacterium]